MRMVLPPSLRDLAYLAYNHLLPTTPTTDTSVVLFDTEDPACPLQREQTSHLMANPNRGADLAASLSRVPNAAGEWRPPLVEHIWQLIVVLG